MKTLLSVFRYFRVCRVRRVRELVKLQAGLAVIGNDFNFIAGFDSAALDDAGELAAVTVKTFG
jgi:hypothetical protein